ncbi:MAG: hypothetical protein HQM08_10430 [Candidatus Riflebacteria bacterium]|nr:hypothetical protein [Candidatus Riflebacteria bacterium]
MKLFFSQWLERLSGREVMALKMLLFFVTSMALGLGVTKPRLENIDALKRGNQTLLRNFSQLAALIDQSRNISSKIKNGNFEGVSGILPEIEDLVRKNASETEAVRVFPYDLMTLDKIIPAARIKIEEAGVKIVGNIVKDLLKTRLSMAEIDLATSIDKKKISGTIIVWKKFKDEKK